MSAAVAYHSLLMPVGLSVSMPSTGPQPPRPTGMISSLKAKPTPPGKEQRVARGRRERPCDACRKRKSKCVTHEGQNNVCAACSVHGQDCTYIEDPQPRKRRLESGGKEADLPKRRSVQYMIARRWIWREMGPNPVDTCIGPSHLNLNQIGRETGHPI